MILTTTTTTTTTPGDSTLMTTRSLTTKLMLAVKKDWKGYSLDVPEGITGAF
jgi:hypothetical protein